MRWFTLAAMLIPLTTLAGCGKQNAKKPAPPKDEVAAVNPEPKPQPPAVVEKPKETPKEDEEPNWLNPAPKVEPPNPQPGATGKLPWGLTPPEGGWQKPPAVAPMPVPQPNPGPAVQPEPKPQPVPAKPDKPNAGGMGKLEPQPQPQPVKPPIVEPPPAGAAVTEADMKDVWIFVENASLAGGKMPAPSLTYQALIQAKSAAAPLVKSGAIFLVPSASRESVWAFDMQAFMNGGAVLVACQNGVETITAAQLKTRLGK